MKKVASGFLLAFFVFQGVIVAYAAQPGTEEYKKLAEYKKAQREKRAAIQSGAQPASTEKSFWQKEADRSGFAGTAAMIGNAVSGAIPLDKPNSRKQ